MNDLMNNMKLILSYNIFDKLDFSESHLDIRQVHVVKNFRGIW